MDFKDVKGVTIIEGDVTKITVNGEVIWEKGGLPSAYQEVEWVQGNLITGSSGAYIDLGFAFDTAATIYIDYVNSNVGGSYVFGAAENSGALRCMITDAGNVSFYGSKGTSYIVAAFSGNTVGPHSYEYHLEEGNLKVVDLLTGTTKSMASQGAYTMTNNLYLFTQNYNGNARFAGYTKISKFSYYDKDNVLICNLVPCYRKSDGVIGMYDTARNIFLTNAGSSNFNKGADV